MDIYQLKFTKLQSEIFRLLTVKTGERLNQREIARFLDVSPTAVAKALPLLEKEGLVKIEKSKSMNLNFIFLNRDSHKVIQFKRAENLKILYESGLVEFLQETHPGCLVILFGSFSKGEDTVKSDIDLAVIGSKGKKIELREFEKRMEKEIRINYYSSLKEIKKELKENLFNGIVLSGSIEL